MKRQVLQRDIGRWIVSRLIQAIGSHGLPIRQPLLNFRHKKARPLLLAFVWPAYKHAHADQFEPPFKHLKVHGLRNVRSVLPGTNKGVKGTNNWWFTSLRRAVDQYTIQHTANMWIVACKWSNAMIGGNDKHPEKPHFSGVSNGMATT